ncbi:Aste57867_12529 [Aphanomyces stellatus]|uniref:Aste57867_12529 protein n=1 Tax=Aphanomyces stellatus TaxID=120398 RepID=A0A485KVV6_9STRA|nr:hypothetical protein As57867_012483 [Aphanomyces stellatus]VFT89380.1 Aste57867_12529 [Aphanomyces stellatus]
MVRILSLAAVAAVASAQGPAPVTFTPIPTPAAWSMKPVRTVQARVQSSAPVWDTTLNAFIANFPTLNGQSTINKWSASLDTVNTASVEGSLFYVQTEGIGADVATSWGCARKTNMSYIWFYDIQFSQPYFSVAEYGADTGKVPEYGAFVAMDNGQCTLQGTTIPAQCFQFSGLNYNPNLGPYVGGENRSTHPKANYNNNVWFSFPGPCWNTPFDKKTEACRTNPALKGGMCPRGTSPDGVSCTYSFDIIGYISIDDLVGITNMTNTATGKPFTSRTDFCRAGLTEFNFETMKSDLTFWNDPLNATANDVRTQKMIDMYTKIVAGKSGDAANFKAFPSVTEMAKANPPCYENNIQCSTAPNGCRRKLLAQICEVCTTAASDCVKKPASAAPFPTLVKQFVPPQPTQANGKPVTPPSPGSPPSAASSAVSAAVGAATALVAVMMM